MCWPGFDAYWETYIFMWDEVSVASVLDPSIIADVHEMYVDVEIDHGITTGIRSPGTR